MVGYHVVLATLILVLELQHPPGYMLRHFQTDIILAEWINMTQSCTQRNIYNRGPGYFKLNNSLLLDGEYQQNIKDNINDIARINKDANPNTLWEIIKGTIRNETIKYASLKKKRNIQIEENHTKEIQRLEIELTSSDDPLQNERLKQEIDIKEKNLKQLWETNLRIHYTF